MISGSYAYTFSIRASTSLILCSMLRSGHSPLRLMLAAQTSLGSRLLLGATLLILLKILRSVLLLNDPRPFYPFIDGFQVKLLQNVLHVQLRIPAFNGNHLGIPPYLYAHFVPVFPVYR